MNKIQQLRIMRAKQEESEALKNSIKVSENYITLSKTIESIQEEQKNLLSEIVDYSEALKDLEQEVIGECVKTNILSTDEYEVKFKKSGTVNAYALRETLQDEDFFFEFVKIPQKAVKDHIKEAGEKAKKDGTENEFKEYKKAISSCIEYTQKADKIILKD